MERCAGHPGMPTAEIRLLTLWLWQRYLRPTSQRNLRFLSMKPANYFSRAESQAATEFFPSLNTPHNTCSVYLTAGWLNGSFIRQPRKCGVVVGTATSHASFAACQSHHRFHQSCRPRSPRLVYELYDLTPEEVAIVEGTQK